MSERGLSVDHTTVWSWVQRYAPEINKRMGLRQAPHHLLLYSRQIDLRSSFRVSTKRVTVEWLQKWTLATGNMHRT